MITLKPPTILCKEICNAIQQCPAFFVTERKGGRVEQNQPARIGAQVYGIGAQAVTIGRLPRITQTGKGCNRGLAVPKPDVKQC